MFNARLRIQTGQKGLDLGGVQTIVGYVGFTRMIGLYLFNHLATHVVGLVNNPQNCPRY